MKPRSLNKPKKPFTKQEQFESILKSLHDQQLDYGFSQADTCKMVAILLANTLRDYDKEVVEDIIVGMVELTVTAIETYQKENSSRIVVPK